MVIQSSDMVLHGIFRDFSIGSRPVPHPVMSREEFEARKADLRRKREREIEKHGERYLIVHYKFFHCL